MKFKLPDSLPTGVAELNALLAQATAAVNEIQARYAAFQAGVGAEMTNEDLEYLEYLAGDGAENSGALGTITAALAVATATEPAAADRLTGALERAAAATAPPAPAPAADAPPEGDPAPEGAAPEGGEPAPEGGAPTAAPVPEEPVEVPSFGAASKKKELPAPAPGEMAKGWQLLPSSPRAREFGDNLVGFAEMAQSMAVLQGGSRTGLHQTGTRGRFGTQTIGQLARELTVVESSEELFEAINQATRFLRDGSPVTAAGLTAAGGWQSPSEQLYDFCTPQPAHDLLSVPEIGLGQRGGVRWPNEPDVDDLLTDFAFQFFFGESALEAVDVDGDPTAIKEFIEIPGVDDFTELRLSVIGYAVKGGILQNQAWPELTAWFLQTFAAAHLRGISWRTINTIVSGSGSPLVVPNDAVLGATTAVLNGLSLHAYNVRVAKGLPRDFPVEGFAPSYFLEVLRADLALRDGLEALAVSDAQITDALAARHIYLQFVGDWNTRGTDQPGNLATLRWPDFMDVVLYPAGTWFRAMSPVMQLGVMFPLQQVQLNQMTHLFTEDGIAVGKRCYPSEIVRIPTCVNGAVGARESITCRTGTVTRTVATTGTPNGGNFTLKFSANNIPSGTIAFNATTGNVDTALTAIDDGVTAAGDITVAGSTSGPWAVTYPAELGELQLGTNSLTAASGTPGVTIS